MLLADLFCLGNHPLQEIPRRVHLVVTHIVSVYRTKKGGNSENITELRIHVVMNIAVISVSP